MKYSFLRTTGVMIMIGAAASLLSGAFVNTFVYDIFAGCVDGSYTPDSNVCAYGVNILVYVVAAFLFFLGGLLLTYTPKMKISSILKIAAFSFIYFWLLVASWKFFEELGNNFAINPNLGPEGFNQYAYLLARRLDFAIIGVIMGIAWWLPLASDRFAIVGSKRKEPKSTSKK